MNVEVSKDNKRFLALRDDDVNMHRVLQESMCKHGFRRRVAKRTLNALGTASGLCGILNDEEAVTKLKSNLKFAESLEEVRHREQQRKQAKAKKKAQDKVNADAARVERTRRKRLKMETTLCTARKKIGLSESSPFKARHLKSLSFAALSAIAFLRFKVGLPGKVEEKRIKLKEIMGPDNGDEDGESDEPENEDEDETETEPAPGEDVSFDKLNISDIVEVFWSGEDTWFEGEVTGIDDGLIVVFYKSDGRQLWHSPDDYRFRLMG